MCLGRVGILGPFVPIESIRLLTVGHPVVLLILGVSPNFAIERNADRSVGFGFANFFQVIGFIISGGFVRVRSSLMLDSPSKLGDT